MKTTRFLLAICVGVTVSAIADNVTAQTHPYNPILQVAAQEQLPAPAPAQPPGRTSPGKFPSGQPMGWRAIKQPGSTRPPVMVPPTPDPGGMMGEEELPSPKATKHPAPKFSRGEVWNDDVHDDLALDYGTPGPGEGCCGPDGCGGDCGCQGDGCGCWDDCGPHFTLLNWIWPRNAAFSVGVHGFKGPADQGFNGNFGFHEGINLSGPIYPCCGLGYQIGGQAFQSNFSGDQVVVSSDDERHQIFLTAGVFRKAMCCYDWQGGVVFDHLHDDYYVDMSLTQIRGELSLVGPHRHEIGMWFTASTEDDGALTAQDDEERWEATDQFSLFYRKNLDCGASCRAWGGFTGRSDMLLGADTHLPLSDSFALAMNFNYIIPQGGTSTSDSAATESWYLGVNIAWYPHCNARCLNSRPLFNVADNGSFMIERLAR